MKRMRQGFTLLELLVASLLLGMLVMTLTSIFQQSSIAWRTGTAGVAKLGDSRLKIAQVQDYVENVLNEQGLRIVSAWDKDGNIRPRAVSLDGYKESGVKIEDPARSGGEISVVGAENRSADSFVVGVMSAGPDREWNTWDDITTWPEEIE